MTRGELAGLLMGPFGADTADRTARRVCAEDGDGAVGELYRLATQPDEGLPRPLRRRVLIVSILRIESLMTMPQTTISSADLTLEDAQASDTETGGKQEHAGSDDRSGEACAG